MMENGYDSGLTSVPGYNPANEIRHCVKVRRSDGVEYFTIVDSRELNWLISPDNGSTPVFYILPTIEFRMEDFTT